MKSTCTLPPVWLNGWKHHLGFLCRIIKHADIYTQDQLIEDLKMMGNSVSDFYTGGLSPASIRNEVLELLKEKGIDSSHSYNKWLAEDGKKYRKLILSDGSCWVLLRGKNPRFYIHVHPSRFSVNSQRIKTSILRTAVAWLIKRSPTASGYTFLNEINELRKTLLCLSPLSEKHLKGIVKTLDVLKKSCNIQLFM